MAERLLELSPAGLYSPQGDFYIDPWLPVARAVLTHVHSDHARPGCDRYLVTTEGHALARLRLGEEAVIDTLDYGQSLAMGPVRVTFVPAGHILGSAQVRLEYQGQVWVVSGDYKRDADPTCRPFEPVACHTLVTESTFALPIFRWPTPESVLEQIHAWWRSNQEQGKASVLYGYSLGKAQRLLSGLDPAIGPICTHGAVENAAQVYRQSGVALPPTLHATAAPKGFDWSRAMILAPPSAHTSPWRRRFGRQSTALASGWMRVRGTRRRRALDRGFVLSDHADWQALLQTIEASGAESVWVTHGYAPIFARFLREQGYLAEALETQFRGEPLDEEAPADVEQPADEQTVDEQAIDGEPAP